MPQLHFYVPNEVAEKLRERAKARGLSLSKYLADIVSQEVAQGWPEAYFEEVVGSWVGEFPDLPDPPPEDSGALL
jgi:hypothetical protein